MDIDAMKKDVAIALKRLPPVLVRDISVLAKKMISEHAQTISAVLPGIVGDLSNHINAIGVEKVTGFLDWPAVEKALTEVFDQHIKEANL